MASFYLDASALVKRYLWEPGSRGEPSHANLRHAQNLRSERERAPDL